MTGAQIRMGRAAVRWSQTELAKRSGISMPTIRRMEAVDGPPPGTHRAVQRVQAALEAAGVVFLPENDEGPGVRWRRAPDEAEA